MWRRYQKGSLILRGKREKVWVGRWLEDEINPDSTVHRRHRSEVLGTLKDYPTKRLAHRALESRLAEVNSVTHRPKHTITFGEFAERWKQSVLPQHKPSSQSSERAHLNRLLPFFGAMNLSDIGVEVLQEVDFTADMRSKDSAELHRDHTHRVGFRKVMGLRLA